jgi:hypothetical protein
MMKCRQQLEADPRYVVRAVLPRLRYLRKEYQVLERATDGLTVVAESFGSGSSDSRKAGGLGEAFAA